VSRWIGGLPLPTFISQALANIWNKKGRLTLTGLTLTTAVGAFMASTAMADTLDTFVEEGYAIYGYEIRIQPQNAEDLDTIVTLVEQSEVEVDGIYRGFDSTVSIPGFVSEEPFSEGATQVAAYGFDPATDAFHLDLEEGEGWKNGETEGVVISSTVADVIGKGAGDPIELMVNGQTLETTIVGVDSYAFDIVFMDWRQLARLAGYVDEQTGEPVAGLIYIDLAGEPSILEVDDEINRISEKLEAAGINASYANQPEAAEMMGEQAGVMAIIFGLMSVVMAAVGAVGLMAALSIAVFERQKEIGVMRSIGARSRTIMSQFMLEGVLVGILAWVLALPISVWLAELLLTTLPFNEIPLIFPLYLVGIGLAGVLMVAALASFGPSLAASRKTVADILRYQ
jgi:putative ABC transport system permease protein